MMNKLFLAAGFAASHVLVAHASVAPRQSAPDEATLSNFNDKCHGNGGACDKAVKHQATCQSIPELASEKKCMCENDYFWTMKMECDDCKVSTGVFDIVDRNHWAKVYNKVKESYCNDPAKTFTAAWNENASEPPAHDSDILRPEDITPTPSNVQPPNYQIYCAHCSFKGTRRINMPTKIGVINVATVTPSAQAAASPVSTAVAVPTPAPFPINNTNANVPAVSANVHPVFIIFDCDALVDLCETCFPKYIGKNPQVVPNAKIEKMDVATVEKNTGATLFDAGWCSCVWNQVLPGTKVNVNGKTAIASFDHIREISEKETSGSPSNGNKPAEVRKPLPGAGPFSADQGVSYPAPIVCPPTPGQDGKPASAPAPKGVVSNVVYGSEVFWPSDKLPKAATGPKPIAPASGHEGAAEPLDQDSTSPKQDSQNRPGGKTTGGAPAVPAGSAIAATGGVGRLQASAVLAVAAVAVAL